MQIEALHLFCDVARFRSFSRSAQAHGVTQSSVSQAVHGLEESMGVSLIDRSSRPWRLTMEGETFYHGCRDLLQRFESLERKVKGMPLSREAEVRVASIYSAGLRHMRAYAETFQRVHSPARVHIEYRHPDQVYEDVLAGTADVGIVSFPKVHRDLSVLPWREEEMVVALPPDHPKAAFEALSPRDLKGEPFIAFDRGLGIRSEVDRYLRRHGIPLEAALEFDNIESIKRAVEIGSGISLLPRPTLDQEVKAGTLALVPLKGGRFVRPLGILRRRGGPRDPRVDEFVQFLEDNVDAKKIESQPKSSPYRQVNP